MITKETVQKDLDAIFNYLVEKDLLKLVAEGISKGMFQHRFTKWIRFGQGFLFNLDKCLGENKIPFATSDLFYCEERNIVEPLVIEFTIKVLNHLNGEN